MKLKQKIKQINRIQMQNNRVPKIYQEVKQKQFLYYKKH